MDNKNETYNQAARLYQQLRRQQMIPNAFENWRTYREALTGYLIELCRDMDDSGTLAVFGAGRCNDLDLELLAAHFSHITLIDYDTAAMQDALQRYHFSENSRFSCISCDFVGISEEEYIHYTALLLEKLKKLREKTAPIDPSMQKNTSPVPAENILFQHLLQPLEELYRSAHAHSFDFGCQHYDYSIAIGVHSQLASMPEWLWRNVVSLYPLSRPTRCSSLIADEQIFDSNYFEEVIPERIKSENPFLTSRLTQAILTATRRRAFFGCETRVAGTEDSIEGAWQTIDDLYKRQKRGELELCSTALLHWPFLSDHHLTYELALFEVQNLLL